MSNTQKLTETENLLQFQAMINELYSIYKKWLNIFPFELEMFKHLKEEFTEELPIIKQCKWTLNDKVNEIEVDIYSNITFNQFLSKKTTSILSKFNTLSLYLEGKIDDIEKHKLDVVIRERIVKLNAQVLRSEQQNPEYIDYITQWFKDEKQFIEDITPYFIKNKKEQKEVKIKRLPAKYYSLYHRLLIEIKMVQPFELVNDTELPKKEIEDYGVVNYGFTDGQSFYREFLRLFKAKKHDITNEFGEGYKQKLIDLSQNNAQIIKHLEKYPN